MKCGKPTDEFRLAINLLPIYVGNIEENKICHAEIVSAAIYKSMYPDTFYYYLPEYEDENSRRWIAAKLKRFSEEFAMNIEVTFDAEISQKFSSSPFKSPTN